MWLIRYVYGIIYAYFLFFVRMLVHKGILRRYRYYLLVIHLPFSLYVEATSYSIVVESSRQLIRQFFSQVYSSFWHIVVGITWSVCFSAVGSYFRSAIENWRIIAIGEIEIRVDTYVKAPTYVLCTTHVHDSKYRTIRFLGFFFLFLAF